MLKSIITLTILMTLASCSAVREVNQKTSEASSDASMVENSADNLDRALATGKRIKERFHPKK